MENKARITADDLVRLDFCADLTQDDRAILASLITPIEVDFDQSVFRSGEAADACYLVERGLIALEICAAGIGCRRIGTAGPGELIGWSPLLAGSCFSATARAVQDSRVLRIPAEELRKTCDLNPAFGYQILKRVVRVLADRINGTRMQMLDMFGPEHPTIFDFPEPVSPKGDGNGNH
jgi:CRP-like cAMP-binding protein